MPPGTPQTIASAESAPESCGSGEQTPKPDLVLHIGGLAADGGNPPHAPEKPRHGLSPLQYGVLELLAQGNTKKKVARRLDTSDGDVDHTKHELRSIFQTPSLSKCVHLAIESGILPVEILPNEEITRQLSNFDRTMLKYYARGGSNTYFVKSRNVPRNVIEIFHDNLLKKVGAWSRPHAIARAHMLGINLDS